MSSFEDLIPVRADRDRLIDAIIRLGVTEAELLDDNDRAYYVIFVPKEDIDRLGERYASIELTNALPGRKVSVHYKSREVSTVILPICA